MRALFTSWLSGAVFGVGLAVSGMTLPPRVIGFLDVTGQWDPSLAFVMAGALAVHSVTRRWILRRTAPLFAPTFPRFTTTSIDGRLVLGATLFGIGWGLSGVCPGPALTSLASGTAESLTFCAAMLGGMFLFHVLKPGAAEQKAEAPLPV